MNKILYNVFLSLVIFFLLLLLMIEFLLYTQSGLMYTFNTLNRLYPGVLVIRQIQGRLRNHVALKDIVYTSACFTATAKNIDLVWDPLQLIRRKLSIQFLKADDIKLYLHPVEGGQCTPKKWLEKLAVKGAILNNLQIIDNNVVTGQIDKITTTFIPPDSNQFVMQFKKGFIYGTYTLKETNLNDWHVQGEAINFDVGYLQPGYKTNLNFKFVGENSLQNYAHWVVTEINGTIFSHSATGVFDIYTSDNQIHINNLNLKIGSASILAAGSIGNNWDVVWNIKIPNLKELYPRGYGSFSSQGKIFTSNDKPLVQGTVQGQNIKFDSTRIASIKGQILSPSTLNNIKLELKLIKLQIMNHVFPVLNVLAKIQWVNNRISSQFIAYVTRNDFLKGTIVTRSSFLVNSKTPVRGIVYINAHDWLRSFYSQYFNHLNGAVTGKINLLGTVGHPIYTGQINLSNGRVYIPELAISPHNINIAFNLSPSEIVTMNGSFISGKGEGTFHGQANINRSFIPENIYVKGTRLQIANLKDYQIIATPDVNLSLKNGLVAVSGAITIPFMRLELQHYNDVLELPSEVVFVGTKTHELNYFKKFMLRLHILLGDDVFVNYKNLHAFLGGDLFVFQVPGGLPSGRGEVVIRQGTYQVYNRLFSIKDGRLIYVGNLLSNPGLSIRAMQITSSPQTNFLGFARASSTDSLTVGVLITGTLDHPIIDFVSNPPMSQDDILSHLVFGKSRADLSGADVLSLFGALSADLNLHDVTLGDQPAQKPGIFSIFKIGFTNPIQAFNFSIPFSKHLRIQTESSLSEIGIDLLYHYETDEEFFD